MPEMVLEHTGGVKVHILKEVAVFDTLTTITSYLAVGGGDLYTGLGWLLTMLCNCASMRFPGLFVDQIAW